NLKFAFMDISVFFKPSLFRESLSTEFYPEQLIHHVAFFEGDMEELKDKKIAIIGVKEGRAGLDNTTCSDAPDEIRKWFYKLYRFDEKINIIDLGNIEQGNEIRDTYYALNQTCQVLLKKGIVPVIIGGSQDLTYPNYLAYEH